MFFKKIQLEMEKALVIKSIEACIQPCLAKMVRRGQMLQLLNGYFLEFDNLTKKFLLKKQELEDRLHDNELKSKDISDLANAIENQNVEIVRLKQEEQQLTKTMKTMFENSYKQTLSESDEKKGFDQKLLFDFSKRLTKIYIDDNSQSNIIQGFAINTDEKNVRPFEYDITQIAESDLRENLYGLMKITVCYQNEWENLFKL